MMYSLLERHADGSLWYHPGHTFATPEEVESDFKRTFWWDLDRPHIVFEHDKPHADNKYKRLQRWVNMRSTFAAVKRFEDYK